MSRDYFVFIGQRATTGTPHPRTGRYNVYGRYLRFASQSGRAQFIDSYQCAPGEYCKPCSIRTGRQYSRGMSHRAYVEYMQSLPYHDGVLA